MSLTRRRSIGAFAWRKALRRFVLASQKAKTRLRKLPWADHPSRLIAKYLPGLKAEYSAIAPAKVTMQNPWALFRGTLPRSPGEVKREESAPSPRLGGRGAYPRKYAGSMAGEGSGAAPHLFG